jgi:hypothetical protein
MSFANQDFHRVGEVHGVTVYKNDHAHGIALAAEADIDAPPDKVLRVLFDYASHPRWNKNLKESRVLQRGEGWLLVYQRLGLPMIDDRDFTLRVSWGQSPDGGRWLRFSTDGAGPPPQRGAVRVSTHEGRWELSPIDGGRRTHASYLFHLDLAGSLPGWLSRGRASKDVPHLFDQIREQLKYY